MLNMENVGIKISKMRKAKGWTQMELADQLFVSFQAVSNWERGETMPDISKLMALSELLGVSIDELLNHDRTSHIITKTVLNEKIEDLTVGEIEAVAPLLKTIHIDHLCKSTALDGIEDILILAPFASTELVDEFAQLQNQNLGFSKLTPLFPFLSDRLLESLAMERYEKEGLNSVVTALPFLRDELLDKMAAERYLLNGIHDIVILLPFLNDRLIREYFDDIVKNGKAQDLQLVIPFLDEDEVNELFKKKFMNK